DGGNTTYPNGSNPGSFLSTDFGLFFLADDVVHGYELWVTNGTGEGTRLVRDLTPGQSEGYDGEMRGNASDISRLVQMGSDVYFVLNTKELWATDGTAAGTRMIRDLNGDAPDQPAVGSGSYASMAVLTNSDGEQRLLFSGYDGDNRTVLWTSDGTFDGTQPVFGAAAPAAPLVDFNGDGIADTLWQQSGSNAFMAFMYDESGNLSGQRLLGMDPGYSVVGTGDFDGNGVTDLIWEESASGVQVGWLLNADGSLAQATGLVGAPWRLQASGDFDGNGTTDLVWQYGVGGGTAVWLMDGLSIAGSEGLNDRPDFELVETAADFDADGDGKTDLIWRAVASGAHSLFRMNGVGVSSVVPLGGGLEQEISGTGDFDGDGAHDIVWRELGSGRRLLRYYVDGQFTGTEAELELGSDWSLAGTFDADADGRSDILWRYDAPGAFQGANILWLMDGATPRGQRSLGGDATWRLFARQ
ncbi:MAG: FG-GAP-like repeat-containing protein, partial [Pirellulales bacterium]